MTEKHNKSHDRLRPSPQPSDVLIKILGICIIVAGIAAVAVGIRNNLLEDTNTGEYLSNEAWKEATSKPEWHYSDPIPHHNEEPAAPDASQLNEPTPLSPNEQKQVSETEDSSSHWLKTTSALVRETTTREADDALMLTEAVGIEKINSATVIHSPYGFSNHGGRATAFVTDQKTLGELYQVLGKFPAKGGVFKQWPEDIGHRRIYLHGNDHKVLALDIYGHALQSPIDATFSAPKDDPQNTELMKLLEGVDRNAQTQRFRDRAGPLSKPRESNWRPTDRDRDRIIAAVKANDHEAPPIGEPKAWQWDEAELYVDGKDNNLLWIFFRSKKGVKIWRWVELDSEAKRILSSGWGQG